ncbi:MAG: hypothetical protein ACOVQE_11400 [Chitinophagaceae bacterium]
MPIQLPTNFCHNFFSDDALQKLSSVAAIPEIDAAFSDKNVSQIVQYYALNTADLELELLKYAHTLLNNNKVAHAWQVILMIEPF